MAKDFAYTIMDPRYELLRWQKGWCLTLFCCCPGCARCALCSDVETFTQLTTHQVKQTMHIPFFQVCALLTVSHRARCSLTLVLLPQSFTVLDQFLRAMYEDVRKVCACVLCVWCWGCSCAEHLLQVATGGTKTQSVLVADKVCVSHCPPDRVKLSWLAAPVSDMVADSVAMVVLQAAASTAGVKGTKLAAAVAPRCTE